MGEQGTRTDGGVDDRGSVMMDFRRTRLCAGPGEKSDIAGQHRDVAEKLDKAYDVWWAEVVPCT